jgi:hypothetical protein
MKWSSYVRPCIAVTFGLLDCTVATLLYGSGIQFSVHLHTDTSPYHFETSTIELWFIAVLRSAVLLGASIGVIFNVTDGPKRLQEKGYIFFTLATLLAMFAVVKMLVCTEYLEVTAWFWCEFAWSLSGSLTFCIGYSMLRTINVSPATNVSNNINETEGERRRLLPDVQATTANDDTEKDQEETTTKAKISTICRLAAYSKPDVHYLLVAFIFMVISSVCKYS